MSGKLVNMNNLNNSVKSDTDLYTSYTHKLNDYNELYNANNQLKNVNRNELDKMSTFSNNVDNRLHILKQNYLLSEAGVNQYNLRIKILIITIIVLSILVSLASYSFEGKIQTKTMINIVIGTVIGWLLIIYIVVKINSSRRNDSWQQYYF